MTLDNTDYKIIINALYVLATDDTVDISDDVSALNDDELEQRLLSLRQHFSYLERKSHYAEHTDDQTR